MRAGLAFAAAVLSLAANAANAANAADPVAFVADLQGNASIEGNGNVSFLAELGAGTRLLLGTGSQVAVTYASSGSEYTLRGPGEFVVGAVAVKADKGAAPTRRTVTTLPDGGVVTRISKTATASLRMRNVQPHVVKVGLDFPVDTKVATLQPVLRWTPPSGEGAEVTLLDAGGKELWRAKAEQGSARPDRKSVV